MKIIRHNRLPKATLKDIEIILGREINIEVLSEGRTTAILPDVIVKRGDAQILGANTVNDRTIKEALDKLAKSLSGYSIFDKIAMKLYEPYDIAVGELNEDESGWKE